MGAKHGKPGKGPWLIVVFGATGAQGGSVAQALAKDDYFRVRAVTRNASSDKARALEDQGKLKSRSLGRTSTDSTIV